MDIGVPEFAEKYGIRPDTVRRWCRNSLIPGATQGGKGKPWHIPVDAVPPGRKRKYKTNRDVQK